MRNLVVSGYYGSKNAGDEAMLAAMLEVLSDLDPKLHITVISADPEDTRARHGVDAVSWLDITRILQLLGRADLLISGGGSLLQNVTSRRSLYYYLGIIFLALAVKTPVMLYAQGIGPIRGRLACALTRHIVNRVQLITVRDHGSLAELSRLGIRRPRIEATADAVLAIHPVDREAGRLILTANRAEGARPVVGISVRDWCGWTQYKEALAQAADEIVRTYGARVVFLPMQFPEDVRAAESVAARMQEPYTVLPGEYTTAELLSLVGNMDLMIAVRLHALIFAGVMGVPLIGISYDPKIDRFLDSIGEQPAGKLDTLTAPVLLAAVREKWEHRRAIRQHNAALLKKQRGLAARNAELAIELLEK
ncbi:polysaccharide pyruvyl transferase CsaB [Selenomonas bovis]|uniref:polysaccharide pyruvyl transferase CsaB n=1 Tax=Selenomonas bovis TaxID=416586 RepID=UPI003AB99E41